MHGADACLRRAWRRRGALAWALRPLAALYGALLALHRLPWALGWRRVGRAGVPVIVVGNVVAGGGGKTPLVLSLVQHLRARGWQPGIISRGYGRTTGDCRAVLPHSSPEEAGDEPLLLARASQVPVFVARQRMQAVRALRQQHPQVDIILSDDGLQHRALGCDIALCVFNAEGLGNGWLLPAGPLREPWPRPVSAVLHSGCAAPALPPATPAFAVQRQLATQARNAHGQCVALAALAAAHPGGVEAVAATARPQEFFAMLTAQGLALRHMQALPDHYNFRAFQRLGAPSCALLCTEKDAVKLWRSHPQAWTVGLQVQLPAAFRDWFDDRLAHLAV